MPRLTAIIGSLTVALLFFAASASHAGQSCKTVKGHITSEVVPVFSDGIPCPNPAGLCTEGRFSGGLKGRFTFIATSLTPADALDEYAPADVAATTGVIELKTRRCRGLLVIDDVSAFSGGPDGFFGSVQTPNVEASSGSCADVTGRLRAFGVFQGGCVNCTYEGELCGLRSRRGHDNDDDDDRDD